MPRTTLPVLLLLLCAPLCASSEDYEVFAACGVGRLTRSPYVPVRVTVMRTELQPFTGRIVIEVEGLGSATGGDVSTYSTQFSMEAGRAEAIVPLTLPLTELGANGRVLLEHAVGDGRFEPVAEGQFNASSRSSDVVVAGFVSAARLETVNAFSMNYALLEAPLVDWVSDWKSLAAFDALIVNSEQLTRQQNEALLEYVAAGGTLILSPRTAASFNPGLPASELLGIAATSRAGQVRLGDYGFLLGELLEAPAGTTAAGRLDHGSYPGYFPRRGRPGRMGPGVPKPAEVTPEAQPETQPGAAPAKSKLERPDLETVFDVWTSAGRARALTRAKGLISVARVGAGKVVFIHTDISRPPFTVAAGDDRPTLAGANLLFEALREAADRGMGRTPLNILASQNGREAVDIAGHRIPGNATMIIVAFVYVFTAGIGVFFLARKIRRPELYPAGLLVLGILSVVGVFGIGNWFKRAGDRVQAIRVIVSDSITGRAGVYTLGCAYLPGGGDYSFRQGLSASLVPAQLSERASRGMPNDLLTVTARTAGSEVTTSLSGLSQWQNLFFVGAEPVKRESLKLNVTGTEGALTLENPSDLDLRSCLVLVGRDPGTPAQWHYVKELQGGASVSLTASTTQFSEVVGVLKERLAGDLGRQSLDYRSMITLLRRQDPYLDGAALEDIEKSALLEAGLMPISGEVLVIALLQPDALSAQSLGTPEDSQVVRQSCLWCALCAIGEK
ncbi:hypothetical protein EDM80_00220 [bacterium]|nr:MAG: hypothetical protein EDM80_00220 [bacterium]